MRRSDAGSRDMSPWEWSSRIPHGAQRNNRGECGGGDNTGPVFEVSHSQPGQNTLPKAGFLSGGLPGL